MSQALIKLSLLSFVVMSCVPAHLQKYNQRSAVSSSSNSKKAVTEPLSALTSLKNGRYQINASSSSVFESALNTILNNYTLNIVSRETGVISTNWDSYYIGDTVYRNRVSLRIRYRSRSQSEIIVHNTVEKLKDGSAAGTVGAVWLPASDQAEEVNRIVKNIGFELGISEHRMQIKKVAQTNSNHSNM